MKSTSTEGSRPKAPGMAYMATTLAMVVVVAAVGVTTRQGPPPTVAEFAPRSVEQVRDASEEQALGAGGANEGEPLGGTEGDGGTTTTTTTTTTPADGTDGGPRVPRANRCVGSPPRQIEDPQSPPCVPFWSGDNGGATYRGVSGTEIRIGVPQFEPYFHPILEAFFNQRFEFYGRKLKLIDLGGSKSSPEEQIAAAEDADEKQVFASAEMYEAYHYQEELARRGIISVARTPLYSESMMRERRPYVWGYPMANDRMFGSIGEWICARLAGKKAAHAGPLLAARDRVYGLVFQVTAGAGNPAGTAPLERSLDACGVKIAARARYSGGVDTLDPAKAAGSTDAMRSAGVTTIICLCDSAVMGGMGRAATVQGYFPEWLMSTYIQQDISYVVRTFAPPEQLEHAFGLTFLPREVRPEDHPSWRAAKEIDPSGDQYTGDPVKLTEWDIAYRGILLLASGIQLAGPKLTPQAFEEGMSEAAFPNPADRSMPGAVGFADRDHTMTNDAAEFWWSNQASDPYKRQPGAFCYVAGGVRHEPGSWPRNVPDPFFTGPCDSGA